MCVWGGGGERSVALPKSSSKGKERQGVSPLHRRAWGAALYLPGDLPSTSEMWDGASVDYTNVKKRTDFCCCERTCMYVLEGVCGLFW